MASDGTIAVAGSRVEHLVTANPAAATQSEDVLTFGVSTYTARPGSHDFVIDGQTLSQGGTITVSGIAISYPTNSFVVVGSSTQKVRTATPAEVTFGGSTFTADADGDFELDGQTLRPGGVMTVDGTSISYAVDGADVVFGSDTQFLAAVTWYKPTITFESSIYTADAASNFVIGGQPLTPGGVITVDGIPISYDPRGTDVIVGSKTQYFATGAGYGATITFEGSTYVADAAGDFVIAGQTLTPGGAITVDGTPISFAAEDESDVVIGTSTEAMGLGSYIMGGFGNGFDTVTAGGSNYTGTVFSSRASGRYDSCLGWRRGFSVGIVVVIISVML